MGAIAASGTVIDRGDIAGLLDSWARSNANFVATRICPVIETDKETDTYWQRDEDKLLKGGDSSERAPGTPFKRDLTELRQNSFTVKYYGREAVVPLETQAKYKDKFDLKSKRAQDKAFEQMLELELRWANKLINENNFPPDGSYGVTLAVPWADTENSTPFNDLATEREACFRLCGTVPNTLVLPDEEIFDLLCVNKQLRERVGLRYVSGDTGALTPEGLARALRVERILVAKAVYNATPNAPTATLRQVWDEDYAFYAVVDESEDWESICIGKTVAKSDVGGLFDSYEYHQDDINSDVVRVSQATAEQLVIRKAGRLIKGLRYEHGGGD